MCGIKTISGNLYNCRNASGAKKWMPRTDSTAPLKRRSTQTSSLGTSHLGYRAEYLVLLCTLQGGRRSGRTKSASNPPSCSNLGGSRSLTCGMRTATPPAAQAHCDTQIKDSTSRTIRLGVVSAPHILQAHSHRAFCLPTPNSHWVCLACANTP